MGKLKIHLKSPAALNKWKDAFGFGRVYQSLVKELARRDDVRLVKDFRRADIQVCLCLPFQRWEYSHWFSDNIYPLRRKNLFNRFRRWWENMALGDNHPVKVVYTVWETTRLPYGWDEVLNEMAAVFTASSWCAAVIQNDGVAPPVHVVPHGIDPESFPYVERDWQAKPFVYLSQYMHPHDRKGGMLVRQAFAELNLPDTYLVEKWYPTISAAWGPANYPEARRVEIGQFLNRDSYMDLLRQCHVSVNPFRGEAFALMPAETAATGMATILTNWSGATDYMQPDCFRPLKYTLCAPGEDYVNTQSAYEARTPPAQDALVDPVDLRGAMREMYENRESAKWMGVKARDHLLRSWTWEHAANKFVASCQEVLSVQ